MPTETNIENLKINYMSKEQYDAATKSDNELYVVLDEKEYAVSSHTHSAGDITSGTLSVDRGGTGYTSIADTTYTTARYRASALVSAETTPSTNGVINWTYS